MSILSPMGFSLPDAGDTANIENAIHPFAEAMDSRAIMRFNSEQVRDQVLTSPIEGQVCYRHDIKMLEFYNGTEWLPLYSNKVQCVNTYGLGAGSGGPDTTTSTTLSNIIGSGSASALQGSFRKTHNSTRIKVFMSLTFRFSATGMGGVGAVRIGGVDYEICHLSGTQHGAFHQLACGIRYLTGIDKGLYTVTARWRRTSQLSGTVSMDGNDWVSVYVSEVI